MDSDQCTERTKWLRLAYINGQISLKFEIYADTNVGVRQAKFH